MLKNLCSFISCLLIFGGCSQQTPSHTQAMHTNKLKRPVSVSFLSQTVVEVKSGPEAKNLSLKIYLKKDKSKKLIEVFDALKEHKVELSLPNDLSEYAYIVAVVEGTDHQGHQLSEVDTYKIGEQEMINKAKNKLINKN